MCVYICIYLIEIYATVNAKMLVNENPRISIRSRAGSGLKRRPRGPQQDDRVPGVFIAGELTANRRRVRAWGLCCPASSAEAKLTSTWGSGFQRSAAPLPPSQASPVKERQDLTQVPISQNS